VQDITNFLKELKNFEIKEQKNSYKLISRRGLKRVIHIPKSIDNEICYLSGLIMGDGCLNITEEPKHGKRYRMTIDSIEKNTLKKLKEILKKRFNLITKIKRVKRAYRIEIKCKPLVLFLNKIFQIKIGKKSFDTLIPSIIKDNKKYTYAFLSGLIDSDFGKYGKTMGISSRGRRLIKDISNFFDNEDIEYLKKTYILNDKPVYHLWLKTQSICKLINNCDYQYNIQHQNRKIELLRRGAGAWKTGR